MREEFLGRDLLIVSHPDPAMAGLAGEVLDETLKTFVVRLEDGRQRRVAKAGGRFLFRIGSRDVEVLGDRIMFRPEDRVKKVR